MSDYLDALSICIQTRLPAFLWGEPGIGKTQTLIALAKALDEKQWTVILSIREPSDQGGLPYYDNGQVVMVPPSWARELVKEGVGQVFFDELNVAEPATQNSALRVVNEGWAGDLKLPATTSFTAAGNMPETNPGAYNLTAAMANRFVHFKVPSDVNGWCSGTLAGWPAPKVSRLPPDWRDNIQRYKGLVVAFVQKNGDILDAKPTDPTAAGRAWPSRRSWTMTMDLLCAAEALGHSVHSNVARILVDGCVGEAAGISFRSYISNLDLKDPELYLADPSTPMPDRQDQVFVTLNGVAAAALSQNYKEPERIDRYLRALKVLGRLHKNGQQDIVVPAARILADNLPEKLLNDLPSEFGDIGDFLEKSGVTFKGN